jgi:hypothetical protein
MSYKHHFEIDFATRSKLEDITQSVIIQALQTTLSLSEIEKEPEVIIL